MSSTPVGPELNAGVGVSGRRISERPGRGRGARRAVVLTLGVVLFGILAVAAGMMALSLGPTHPLMLLLLLVPMPLVFIALRFRPPKAKAARILGYSYLGIAAVLTVAVVGIGWYFSNVLKSGAMVPERTPAKYDMRVAAIGQGRVTLQTTADAKSDGAWIRDGTWGLEWNGGYDQDPGQGPWKPSFQG